MSSESTQERKLPSEWELTSECRNLLEALRQLSGISEKEVGERCLPIRKHRGAREKRYSFGYAVFLILALMK